MPVLQSEPYLELEIEYLRNITKALVEQHKHSWKLKDKQLIAAIFFGPLADKKYDKNINLLEIVKGYPHGKTTPIQEFESTAQFPMYGRLRLQIMSPETFRKSVEKRLPLIEDIRKQNEILLDHQHFAKKLLR